MSKESANLLVCGHTHRPFSRKVEKIWFINDGSVGRPKDGDWRAGWVLLNIEENQTPKIEFMRCEYDLEPLKRIYPNSGLPQKFLNDLLQTENF